MCRGIVWAVALGIALGAFSMIGDGLDPTTPLHVIVALANAAGPWLAIAFAVGALQGTPQRGGVAGAVALTTATFVYYLGIYAGGHQVAEVGRVMASWLAVSGVAGPLLGAAGGLWARSAGRPRSWSAAILCGALLAEAVFRLIQIEGWAGIDLTRSDWQVAVADLLGGLLLPLFLVERSDRRWAYAATLLIATGGTLVIAGVTAAVLAFVQGG
ncbi:MAG: DUF6518 family protein [Chloroflexota bacterium]